MKDLFQHPEEQPAELQAILTRYEREESDYKPLDELQKEVEAIGYTFDIDLNAEPYNLRAVNSTILFSEEKNKGNISNLIPVHINKCRCDNYYWNWSAEQMDWVRGREIPERTKRMYSAQPQVKSSYH